MPKLLGSPIVPKEYREHPAFAVRTDESASLLLSLGFCPLVVTTRWFGLRALPLAVLQKMLTSVPECPPKVGEMGFADR